MTAVGRRIFSDEQLDDAYDAYLAERAAAMVEDDPVSYPTVEFAEAYVGALRPEWVAADFREWLKRGDYDGD